MSDSCFTQDYLGLYVKDTLPHPKQRPRFDKNTGKVYNPVSNIEAEKRILDAFRTTYPKHIPWENCKIIMTVHFYFNENSKHNSGEYHTNRPDIDNLIKTVMDALNGVAYKDDGLICNITATKHYSDEQGIIVILEKAMED